jgi:hypothetical protein
VKVTAKDHDGTAREYEGIALQTLLAKAGVPLGSELRGKNMTLLVVAEATDSYRALFSLAELNAVRLYFYRLRLLFFYFSLHAFYGILPSAHKEGHVHATVETHRPFCGIAGARLSRQ